MQWNVFLHIMIVAGLDALGFDLLESWCKLSKMKTWHSWVQVLTYITAGAIILAALNLIKRSVWEIELLGTMVDGESVGSADVIADDHQDIGSGQLGAHDTGWMLIPVGPKHQADEKQRNVSQWQNIECDIIFTSS